MLTDFQNSFTGRLTGKFATNLCLNILPHLKYVATLPCEIWISENRQQSEICIVFNDKSQDSTAKHLSYDGLRHYKFVNHCAGKRIFKIREHLAKLWATVWCLVFLRHSVYDRRTPDHIYASWLIWNKTTSLSSYVYIWHVTMSCLSFFFVFLFLVLKLQFSLCEWRWI